MSTEFEGEKVLMVYDDYVHLWPLVLSYLTNRISRNGAIHSDLMEKDEERGMNSKGLTEVFARRLCRIDSSLFLLHAVTFCFTRFGVFGTWKMLCVWLERLMREQEYQRGNI